jgi:hypothetical protein
MAADHPALAAAAFGGHIRAAWLAWVVRVVIGLV